jgi:hypothetical protein
MVAQVGVFLFWRCSVCALETAHVTLDEIHALLLSAQDAIPLVPNELTDWDHVDGVGYHKKRKLLEANVPHFHNLVSHLFVYS